MFIDVVGTMFTMKDLGASTKGITGYFNAETDSLFSPSMLEIHLQFLLDRTRHTKNWVWYFVRKKHWKAAQVADLLDISVNTVYYHLRSSPEHGLIYPLILKSPCLGERIKEEWLIEFSQSGASNKNDERLLLEAMFPENTLYEDDEGKNKKNKIFYDLE